MPSLDKPDCYDSVDHLVGEGTHVGMVENHPHSAILRGAEEYLRWTVGQPGRNPEILARIHNALDQHGPVPRRSISRRSWARARSAVGGHYGRHDPPRPRSTAGRGSPMSQIPEPVSSARRFLMVHGVQHRRPRQHWMWWLTETLRQRGEQVLYPQFPAPEQPSLSAWTDLLYAELAQLGDQERVVVCHSLGCALWLRATQTLPKDLPVTRVLLVSPLGDQAFAAANSNEEFSPGHVDAQLFAAASTRRTRAVVSATDPYAPVDPYAWSAALGLHCDILPTAGHITPQDGYGPWPAALDWCLHEQTPVSAATPHTGSSPLGACV